MAPKWRVIVALGFLLPALCTWAGETEPGKVTEQQVEGDLRDVNGFWSQQFVARGDKYRKPDVTFFDQKVSNVCNLSSVLTGPFYCPISQRLYLDSSFMELLSKRGRSEENVLRGYVVAHEVAHHVQAIIGTTAMVEQARSTSTPELANRTLTRMELQADCYTGLWLRSAEKRGVIKLGSNLAEVLSDVESAGRERLAHLATGELMPDPLNQGSASQRLKWVRRGLDGGHFSDCDTFGTEPTEDN